MARSSRAHWEGLARCFLEPRHVERAYKAGQSSLPWAVGPKLLLKTFNNLSTCPCSGKTRRTTHSQVPPSRVSFRAQRSSHQNCVHERIHKTGVPWRKLRPSPRLASTAECPSRGTRGRGELPGCREDVPHAGGSEELGSLPAGEARGMLEA